MTSFFHTRIHLATPGRQRYKKRGTQARPPRKSGEFIVSKKAFVSAERNRLRMLRDGCYWHNQPASVRALLGHNSFVSLANLGSLK
jgi:hypothetical protein